ncbi:MAG: glycosyltransferase family 4 protein [Methylococcales bacterium]|nr:glycosyltransferase family 4 protein [Methylococcales bacterium]
MLFLLILAIISTLAAALLTGLIRHYALANRVLDIPNQRSSHSTPTPRGGGLAIVLVFLFASLYLYSKQYLNTAWFLALNSTLPVALIGFYDDHRPVAARWRFLTHVLAAAIALYFLKDGIHWTLMPMPLDIMVDRTLINPGWFGFFPGIVFLVWFLNLFNFMDGTDGLAASEAVFVSSSLAVYLHFFDPLLCKLAIVLASASLGFLLWNWPKAKIFMGDVGSGFLGLLLGILILMAAQQSPVLLYCGLILFGVFVVDASYTLAVRFCNGQKWYAAHCSHTYQHAARQYGHFRVLMASWAINLLWLLPISLLVYKHPAYALYGLLAAYLPLLFLARRFKAGRTEIKN